MKRFIEGTDRNQVMLLAESVEDYVGAEHVNDFETQGVKSLASG